MATTRRKGVADAARKAAQRVNLKIDVESYERPLVHAIKGKEQPGEIVSRLIDRHLRDWALPAKLSARDRSIDRREIADHESENVPAVA